ncbi:MAG: hypothetical protein MI746_15175 [Pseudomonadales bacterium]|nr:hypothetical protein [Pseudomonadales bacterium]
MHRHLVLALPILLASCGPQSGSGVNVTEIPSQGSTTVRADVWADNWFAFYIGEDLILEDSVPITTERSFNAESFTFNVDLPAQLNFIFKDFKENDTGLEYIGAGNQQMGDGGFIAQFYDTASNELLAYSNSDWQCLVIHEAPLDKSCEDVTGPAVGDGTCGFRRIDEPMGWMSPDFNDAYWPNAVVHTESAVSPRDGYDQIDWDRQAQLLWGDDLETDNTLLCHTTLQ